MNDQVASTDISDWCVSDTPSFDKKATTVVTVSLDIKQIGI